MSLPEQQIRELAYQIWESEGKPHGQEARHWDIACKLAAESLAPAHVATVTADAAKAPKKPRARKEAAAPEVAVSAESIAPAAATPVKTPRTRKASASPQADEPAAAPSAATKPARKSRAKKAEPALNGLEPVSSLEPVNSPEPIKSSEPQMS